MKRPAAVRNKSSKHVIVSGVKALCRQEQINVKILRKRKKSHRDPAGNRTWDLLITSWTLLPLSHWPTAKERKKVSYNSHARGLQLSFSLTVGYTALVMNGDPCQMGLWAWGGLTVQPHCLSEYSHYLEPEAGVMDSESIRVRQLESAEASSIGIISRLASTSLLWVQWLNSKSIQLVTGRSWIRFSAGFLWIFFPPLQSFTPWKVDAIANTHLQAQW